MKNRLQLLLCGLVLGVSTSIVSPFIVTSCNEKKQLSVDWRTEDLEWEIDKPLLVDNNGVSREWVWVNKPKVNGGEWSVANGYRLPRGITLNSTTGSLSGTPIDICNVDVVFQYKVKQYKTSTSPEINFLISNQGSSPVVDWATTFNLSHLKTYVASDNIKIFNNVPSVTGGKYSVRQGFESKLTELNLTLNTDTGILTGKSSIVAKNVEISFEYVASSYTKAVSPKIVFNVGYYHSITGEATPKNTRYRSLHINSLVVYSYNGQVMDFDLLVNFLSENGFTESDNSYKLSAYFIMGDNPSHLNIDHLYTSNQQLDFWDTGVHIKIDYDDFTITPFGDTIS